MIEYDVNVYIECDECGCALGDSSKVYCYDCAKKNGIEEDTNEYYDDKRDLVRVLADEKEWYRVVNEFENRGSTND